MLNHSLIHSRVLGKVCDEKFPNQAILNHSGVGQGAGWGKGVRVGDGGKEKWLEKGAGEKGWGLAKGSGNGGVSEFREKNESREDSRGEKYK